MVPLLLEMIATVLLVDDDGDYGGDENE